MPYYRYRALDAQKRSQQGQIWGVDSEHATSLLQRRGWQKIFLKQPPFWEAWLERQRPTSPQEQSLCCRQLAILFGSGLPIVECLDILLRQPLHPGLYRAYQNTLRLVQSGTSLSAALRKSPEYFDAVFVGMIHIGERTGRLAENLRQLALHQERELALRAKVGAALTYPLVVSLFSLLIAYLIVQHLLPRFLHGLFAQSSITLPWYTQLLVQLTQFFQNPLTGSVAVGTLALLVWAGGRYLGSPAGQYQAYELLLRWKPTRDFFGTLLAVRTARLLATGVVAGLTVVESLHLTEEACANAYLSRYLKICSQDLQDGVPLSRCLRAIPFLPRTLTGFVELGEESTGLVEVLLKSAELMELEVDQVMTTFAQLLEPLMVGALGSFVGFILIALFVPLYQMLGGS